MSATDYMRAGEHTDGINDLILFYNGHYKNHAGVWSAEQFVPYISYVDEQGKPKEWFFDGCLFLAKWSHQFHGYEESRQPNDLADWKWYLDKTFGEGGDLSELNRAMIEVGEQLGDPGRQMKVVIMIPYPDPNQRDFGDIDGSGPLCFDHRAAPDEAHANKQKAIRWYIDQLWKRWDVARYSRLRLSGLYWMNEAVHRQVPREEDLVRFTGGLVHEKRLKFFWIPYFRAESYENWKELGFDAAILQPNHFFSDTDASRIALTAELAKKAGMGVEMEVDYRVFESRAFEQKYVHYLNGGLDYGYAGDVLKGYYQDVKLLETAARSGDREKRKIYDWMFAFVKGRYSRQ